MRLASYEIAIEAPAAVVWRHLTTGDGLVRWVGPEAVAGRFVELVPHRRLVFTYGWEDGRMGIPPGSTTVEIELAEADGVTTLRLTHHGLPPAAVEDHERGWAYFLGALRAALKDG